MNSENTARNPEEKLEEYTPKRGKIRVLSDLVANQIAAGEVVERPASVVKELVENSIDAGATSISVIIDVGGRALVEVVDDGCGMSPDDAVLALERFATSKICSPEELLTISTLGFRGEALPSIAAVSMLSLETSADGEKGLRIEVHGGKIMGVQEIRAPRGTKVKVRSLFFNVRARREFLRSERTEIGFIRALIADFALAAPHIRFRLVVDGKEQLSIPALNRAPQLGAFVTRVRELGFIEREEISAEEFLSGSDSNYRSTVVLSKPLEAVAGSGRLRIIVNGRSVRDRLVLRAVRDGFGNMLHGDRYPTGVVRLDLTARDVDVNVHPQKMEVRFRAPGKIFSVIRRAISQALANANIVSTPSTQQTYAAESNYYSRAVYSPSVSFSNESQMSFMPAAPAPLRELASQTESGAVVGSERIPLSSMRFVGQILKCYLLLESPDGALVIVDMHAAHERVTFARLKAAWSTGEVRRQVLLLPEVVSFAGKQYEGIDELCETLRGIGFDVELLDQDALIIRSVPELLSRMNVVSVFRDLFSEEARLGPGHLDHNVDSVISRIACHSSIRSGQELSLAEVYALLEAVEDAELGGFCPHGRSIARAISAREIETMFGRA